MTTNQTFSLTRLARVATMCPHWRWLDGMRWYLSDPSNEWKEVASGRVGLHPVEEGAIPDLTDNDTISILADRVRYLWQAPDLVCVYEERTGLYRVSLANGSSVARYTSAGAWVGLLELYSYRTEIKNFGRAS